jgi:hypothetical protein
MEWFRRLGDIPGVDYARDPRVNRSKLPGHDDVPETISHEFQGTRRTGLSWPIGSGSGSASPAQRHHSVKSGATAAELLLHMTEGLELPGIPSDYHFIIQGSVEALWTRRREEPEVFEVVEKLCWLDISLIRAKPGSVSIETSSKQNLVRVIAFQRLIDLYEREGFLRDALYVATLAASFEQGDVYVERLRDRIATLDAENGLSCN